jgi:hypothetical protein
MSQKSSTAARDWVTRSIGHLVAEIALAVVRSVLWVGFTTAGIALNIWAAFVLLFLVTPGNVWGYAAVVFGAAIVACAGGVLIGIGQVLALRRWLDGTASLASFLSAVLASSAALIVGTGAVDKEGNALAPFRTWRNTMTGQAAEKLTDLFQFNIPQRWSIAGRPA